MCLGYWTLFFAAVSFLNLVRCDEKDLYFHLKESVFPKTSTSVRPKRNHSKPVDVGIKLELMKIISVEEKEQVMTSVGFFVAEWKDEHLNWSPNVFGSLNDLVIPSSNVWLPDFGLANSAGAFYQSSFLKDFRVRLYYDGRIEWSFGGEISTLCTLDMTFYPFDRQKCAISLENWAYAGHEVSLKNATANITIQEYEPNGVWDIEGTKAEHFNHFFEATNEIIPEVRFTLMLRRKATFYVLNLICPCTLIIIVALAVYWLPADSGEKVSLGVTVLLAFSVFQLVIADQTPVNSDYTPILARMVISIMSLSSVSVLTSIWVLYLHHKDSSRRVPPCIKAFCFRGLATILCMRLVVPQDPDKEERFIPPPILDHGLGDDLNDSLKVVKYDNNLNPALEKILENLQFITNRVKEKDHEDDIMAEWRAVAKILDRLLFWISSVVVLIIFCALVIKQDPSH